MPSRRVRLPVFSRRVLGLALATAIAVCAASAAYAQRFFFRQELPYATEQSFEGMFHFCRAVYRSNPYGDGGNWTTDYPDADRNLSIRLSELTKTAVSRDPVTNDPNFVIVELTSPLLYKCPFIMMFEVGTFDVLPEQAAGLRDYLLKGGFLWVDDFWGEYAWQIWESGIRKVLPETVTYPIVDIPLDHPLFRTVFQMDHFPQIPSINYYLSTGDTSERGAASRPAHVRGIFDHDGRLMVLMTHNTDFGDSWERETVSHDYFLRFSVDGYAFGVDALVYAMTH